LIVNADDFGYTKGVNLAILEACRKGVVTSTSLLANGAAFEDAVEKARTEPKLDIGCHLNFVEGRPVAAPEKVPHLLGGDGQFLRPWQLAVRLTLGVVPVSEIEIEATAQIEKLVQAGLRVTHVDTHKHTHTHPNVAVAISGAARRAGIRWIRRPFENFLPGRTRRLSLKRVLVAGMNLLAPSFGRKMRQDGMAMPDFFTGVVLTGRLSRESFGEVLAELADGTTELMCHPGYCDSELRSASTRLREERELERRTVSDETWLPRLCEREILLTSFGDLAAQRGMEEKERQRLVPHPAS
jgi:predicted glycoside hydrolase/deacetylase ChbG (UPF0249 family)